MGAPLVRRATTLRLSVAWTLPHRLGAQHPAARYPTLFGHLPQPRTRAGAHAPRAIRTGRPPLRYSHTTKWLAGPISRSACLRTPPRLGMGKQMADKSNFPATQRIGILVFDGFEPIDVFGFVEAFTIARFLGTGYASPPPYPFEIALIASE